MVKENGNRLTLKPAGKKKRNGTADQACRGFQKLLNWQVDQYRIAVDENKWYMSERLGRPVEWNEAEYDFVHNGYYGCAPKWRREYCAERCGHFERCGLGQTLCTS